MRIYISGPFNHRPDFEIVKDALTCAGHSVTSNWLNEPPIVYNDPEHAQWEKRARANDDVEDVRRADAIAVFTQWPSTTGGRDTERGIAIAYQRWVRPDYRIFVIGGESTMFDALATFEHFEDIEDFLCAMDDEAPRPSLPLVTHASPEYQP